MKTIKTTSENYDVEIICKTCGHPRKVKYYNVIKHKVGSESIQFGVPAFCIWCSQIAEEKENKIEVEK